MKELYMIAVIPHFDIKPMISDRGFLPLHSHWEKNICWFCVFSKIFLMGIFRITNIHSIRWFEKKILVTWSVMGRLSKEFSVLTQDTLEQVYQYLNILFTSLVQTIKKIGRSWRFTVDCWRLNKVMLSKMLNTQKCC